MSDITVSPFEITPDMISPDMIEHHTYFNEMAKLTNRPMHEVVALTIRCSLAYSRIYSAFDALPTEKKEMLGQNFDDLCFAIEQDP